LPSTPGLWHRVTLRGVEPPVAVDDIDDDELTALALAAGIGPPLGEDAVPLAFDAEAREGLLPDWYMPLPMSAGRGAVRRWVLGSLVLVLVAINCAGLCVTYGVPEIAW
jgi:hypothetical protein